MPDGFGRLDPGCRARLAHVIESDGDVLQRRFEGVHSIAAFVVHGEKIEDLRTLLFQLGERNMGLILSDQVATRKTGDSGASAWIRSSQDVSLPC